MQINKPTVVVIACMLMAAGGWLVYQKTTPQETLPTDIYTCAEDRDCVSVNDGVCGCSMGGSATAIHRKYIEYWNQKNENSEILCAAVLSKHPSCAKKPACVKNKCVLE